MFNFMLQIKLITLIRIVFKLLLYNITIHIYLWNIDYILSDSCSACKSYRLASSCWCSSKVEGLLICSPHQSPHMTTVLGREWGYSFLDTFHSVSPEPLGVNSSLWSTPWQTCVLCTTRPLHSTHWSRHLKSSTLIWAEYSIRENWSQTRIFQSYTVLLVLTLF